LTGRLLDQQKEKVKRIEREKKEANDEGEDIYGRAPEKKMKFNTI
jgi:uncharacterized protein (UPF0335 family)